MVRGLSTLCLWLGDFCSEMSKVNHQDMDKE